MTEQVPLVQSLRSQENTQAALQRKCFDQRLRITLLEQQLAKATHQGTPRRNSKATLAPENYYDFSDSTQESADMQRSARKGRVVYDDKTLQMLRDELDEQRLVNADSERENAALHEQTSQLQDKLERIEGEQEEMVERMKMIKKECMERGQRAESLEERLQRIEADRDSFRTQVETMRDVVDEAHRERDEFVDKLEHTLKREKGAQARAEGLGLQLDSMTIALEKMEGESDSAAKTRSQIELERRKAHNAALEAQKDVHDEKKLRQILEKQLDERNARLKRSVQVSDTLKKQLDAVQNHRDALKASLWSEREMCGLIGDTDGASGAKQILLNADSKEYDECMALLRSYSDKYRNYDKTKYASGWRGDVAGHLKDCLFLLERMKVEVDSRAQLLLAQADETPDIKATLTPE